ncbi:8-oxo-dGDP phosphatase NUDT18 [Coccinella septempunctata]|uniref:8-oxo-dGDP phosphatase NUDT18 n=1 Tax=Coccinella septempunctata TaxID=41139 RepID=UPI001D06FD15|nr:8-oxo-dGDP phosphatase NUDT18 [Coccinella septempunctata]
MPDSVELNIEKVLMGSPLENSESAICDYTLEEQNATLEIQGVKPSISPNFKPVLKETVTYVVAVLVINEQNEVLMIQEAKESCAGKWYLPAGRVDKNETLYDAAIREVLEETGLIVECTTLLKVECAKGFWVRFSYIGHVTGGKLKTVSQADQESLQAKWIGDLNEVTLRADDILPLIERAREYKNRQHNSGWHENIMVGLLSHDRILLRLVVVIRKKSTNRVHVLLSEKTSWHLPVCEIHPAKSLHSTLRRFMVDLFGAGVPIHKPHGILSVEHHYSNGDGLCITLLVVFKPPLEEVPIIGKCVWHETSTELGDNLLQRVSNKNSTIPLHVIC